MVTRASSGFRKGRPSSLVRVPTMVWLALLTMARVSAETLAIVKRANQTMVGTLTKEEGRPFLKPDDARVTMLVLLKSWPSHGMEGQKAVAKITHWPSQTGSLQGEIEEILGFP